MPRSTAPTVVTRNVEVEVPQATDLISAKSLDRLRKLVIDRAKLATQLAVLEARKSELTTDIQIILDKARVKPGSALLVADRYKVSYVASSHSRLSKDRLLEEGVSAKTIADCTIVTPSQYVRIDDLAAKA